MIRGRRLAMALLVVLLGASCGGGGEVRLPTARLVVEAVHDTWPDGKPVESGGLHYPTDIYVVDVTGRHLRNLTHDAATNYLLAWLPATRRLLFENAPSDRMRGGRFGIFSIKLDGSGLMQLASGKDELRPQLSPDLSRIMYAQGRWLYLMRADGRGKRRLAQTSFGYYQPSAYGPAEAAWSADGRQIAFVRGRAKERGYGDGINPRSALYVINADGSGLRAITPVRPKVEAMEPMWLADGRRIVFTEHDYSGSGIRDLTYLISTDGTHKTRLPQLDNGSDWFRLPDGRIGYCCTAKGFAAVNPDGNHKPEALPARFHLGNQIVFNGPVERLREWPLSPDGNWIATWQFNGKAPLSGRYGIWIEHPDRTQRHLVTRRICCFFSSWDIEWAPH